MLKYIAVLYTFLALSSIARHGEVEAFKKVFFLRGGSGHAARPAPAPRPAPTPAPAPAPAIDPAALLQGVQSAVQGKLQQVQGLLGGLVQQKQSLLGSLVQQKQNALGSLVQQKQNAFGSLVQQKQSALNSFVQQKRNLIDSLQRPKRTVTEMLLNRVHNLPNNNKMPTKNHVDMNQNPYMPAPVPPQPPPPPLPLPSPRPFIQTQYYMDPVADDHPVDVIKGNGLGADDDDAGDDDVTDVTGQNIDPMASLGTNAPSVHYY